jgi:hypothetical protein
MEYGRAIVVDGLRSLEMGPSESVIYDREIGLRLLYEDPDSGAEHYLIRYPAGLRTRLHRHTAATPRPMGLLPVRHHLRRPRRRAAHRRMTAAAAVRSRQSSSSSARISPQRSRHSAQMLGGVPRRRLARPPVLAPRPDLPGFAATARRSGATAMPLA